MIDDLSQPVTEVVTALGFATSKGDVRRVAQQNGLRLVVESAGNQQQLTLNAEDARAPRCTRSRGAVSVARHCSSRS